MIYRVHETRQTRGSIKGKESLQRKLAKACKSLQKLQRKLAKIVPRAIARIAGPPTMDGGRERRGAKTILFGLFGRRRADVRRVLSRLSARLVAGRAVAVGSCARVSSCPRLSRYKPRRRSVKRARAARLCSGFHSSSSALLAVQPAPRAALRLPRFGLEDPVLARLRAAAPWPRRRAPAARRAPALLAAARAPAALRPAGRPASPSPSSPPRARRSFAATPRALLSRRARARTRARPPRARRTAARSRGETADARPSFAWSPG